MATSDILTVLGILATVVFGVWGLIVVLRRRYPGEISFVREPYLGLFESIVKNLPELSVQYNNVPVSQGLVLVKGALLNSGSKDISEPMVEGKLRFSLPEHFKWLTANIVSTSPNVKASVIADERNLTFSTGLFRCSEFIRFQAIAEVPLVDRDGKKHTDAIEERLDQAISIKHRIADTKSVAIIDLPSPRMGKRRVSRWLTLAVTTTIVVLLSSLDILFKGLPVDIHWLIRSTNGVPSEVALSPSLDGSVDVKGINSKHREKLSVGKFFDTYHPTPKIALRPKFRVLLIGGALYIAVPWLIYVAASRERRKGAKLRQLLQIEDA